MLDISWVKSLDPSDVAYVNLISTMRIYKYNLRYMNISDNIIIKPADAISVDFITVLLKTQHGEAFKMTYYLPDSETEKFVDKLTNDFTTHIQGGDAYGENN